MKTLCRLVLIVSVLLPTVVARAALGDESLLGTGAPGELVLAREGAAAPIHVATEDWPGVQRAARDLAADIERVTGIKASAGTGAPTGRTVVLIGTLGKSPLIDGLVAAGKLNADAIRGQWESFILQTVEQPLPGVERALVIAGSDKRGTTYGVYEISQQIGVSPWYWWGDVTPEHRATLTLKAGRTVVTSPSVKYRGIFLNDEAPDLTNWVRAKFGNVTKEANPNVIPNVANYGREFYTRIFELMLRVRANYLWPAMWNNAFNEDDPENARLADEYGIVMGTSHQEPMLRAQKEWDWRFQKSIGTWNYAKHPEVLENFWREGVRRNKSYESIVTMGLRGANDTEMAPGGPENRKLLEHIVDQQRDILRAEVNSDLTQVPQMWCLYKEVQEFYEHGMRVPDDITLLWAEDNWGNIRRLPTAAERKRPGGAGIYYHFDYHGGPRSYQWLNTSPIPKIWEQMSLAKQYGADRIWIVNVGHFKGYEFPLEYFLNLGWNTNRWNNENFDQYTRAWAAREFGAEQAGAIADLMAKYSKYNGRRKPEMLTPETYSLTDYQEGETVVADYQAVAKKAEEVGKLLPATKQDAYHQLVLFPAKASALVNELYLAAGRNALYAKQGRASAAGQAVETRKLFEQFMGMVNHFNGPYADGRWAHFMDQPVLGYTTWRDPPVNSLNHLKLVEPVAPEAAGLGVAIEGTADAVATGATLPKFDSLNRQRSYIDVFNRGQGTFDFTATASAPWIVLSAAGGSAATDQRLWVSIDWSKAPAGNASGTVTLKGAGTEVAVQVEAFNPAEISRDNLVGFAEGRGVVSIEPEHYSKRFESGTNHWIKVDDYGRTLSGMRTMGPVDAPSATPGRDSPCLEYQVYLFTTGPVEVTAITAPTLNFVPDRGVRYAVSFDDEAPQVVTLVPQGYQAQNRNPAWEKSVGDNAHYGRSKHTIAKTGYHTLKVWMVDPAVVVQKLVVDLGGLKPSYLGPTESFRGPAQYGFGNQDPAAAEQRRKLSEAAATDRKLMLTKLGLKEPGPFPPFADDPNRPAGTTPVPGNAYNWSDGNPGHVIVRSSYGKWSNYDLAKAGPGPLPDPLLLKNGQRVTSADMWWKQRRGEILQDFQTEIYGRIPVQTPGIKWEIVDVDSHALGGTAHMKRVIGHIDNSRYPAATPRIEFTLYTPANATGPVPLVVTLAYAGFPRQVTNGPSPLQQVLARGWGFATFVPTAVQADSGGGLNAGIIGLVNEGKPRAPDDWGSIAAWSWGLSRMIDYLETDSTVDPKRLAVEGHSRYGKAVIAAAAFEPRWAAVYSSCAGEGGTKLTRHNLGQQLDNVAGPAEYHWMAGNYLKYAGNWEKLPIDQHELIALVAPRAVFVSGGTTDLWSDPVGEFLACVAAGPVYRLLGKQDVGRTEVPAPDEELISGDIGYRMHEGGHSDLPDWPTFLKFAAKYFK